MPPCALRSNAKLLLKATGAAGDGEVANSETLAGCIMSSFPTSRVEKQKSSSWIDRWLTSNEQQIPQ